MTQRNMGQLQQKGAYLNSHIAMSIDISLILRDPSIGIIAGKGSSSLLSFLRHSMRLMIAVSIEAWAAQILRKEVNTTLLEISRLHLEINDVTCV